MKLLHSFADRMADQVFDRLRTQMAQTEVYGFLVLAPSDSMTDTSNLLHATLGPIVDLYPYGLICRYIRGFAAADPYSLPMQTPPNSYIYLSEPIERYEAAYLSGYTVRRAIYRRVVAQSPFPTIFTHKTIAERVSSIYSERYAKIVDSAFGAQ